MENKQQIENIKRMQKEKDVVILAHYYVDGAVQEIADFVGDSFSWQKKRFRSRIRTYYSVAFPLWERAQRY